MFHFKDESNDFKLNKLEHTRRKGLCDMHTNNEEMLFPLRNRENLKDFSAIYWERRYTQKIMRKQKKEVN